MNKIPEPLSKDDEEDIIFLIRWYLSPYLIACILSIIFICLGGLVLVSALVEML
jgi:hypothetical protein